MAHSADPATPPPAPDTAPGNTSATKAGTASAADTESRTGVGFVLSSAELEGVAPAADWSRWIARGRAPDSARGSSAVPFRESWTEDLARLVSLGGDSVVLTLDWAALEPRPGDYDQAEIEFRRQVLEGALELGLEPWGCLIDRTLPGWFAEDEGGFGDDRSRNLLWPRHVDWIGETFGDLVAGWIPQREPLLDALSRHWLGLAPPGRRNAVAAAEAVRDAMLADGEAWRLLRGSSPVATYQTARLIVPDPERPGSAAQARGMERLLWLPWLSALSEGRLRVGDLPERTVDHLRDAFDRLIVQLRAPIRVDETGRWLHHPPDRRPGPTGLVAWPEALEETAARVAEEADGRTVVAAADLADVADDGRARADHLQMLLDLPAAHGLAGLWLSSPIDGYHFHHGFDLRPGTVTRERTETDAAAQLRRSVGRREA